MQDENKKTEDQILSELLKNVPDTSEVEVTLPSKNRFYTLDDPSKPITIRPMTFQDEKAMMSSRNSSMDTINLLLGRCLNNVKIASLLQIDKLFAIMKIREISYGDDYLVSIPCGGCKSENRVKFTLSQLNVNFVDDKFQNPHKLHLPVIDKNITIRLPRVSDEKYMINAEVTTNNLWRFIEDIDGHSSKSIIQKVCEKLPLKDAHTILNFLGGDGYGLDTRVQFACSYCNHSEVIDLPITSDFFTEN